MIEIQGKYNTAKVFTENIENEAYSQILNMMCQIWAKDVNVAIMPDVHAGKGCTVGTTMTIKDKIVPNLVGVDIGCGMLVAKIKTKGHIEFGKLDKLIKEKIPSGKEHRDNKHRFAKDFEKFDELIADVRREELNSIGSLGGGNHFIEVDQDDDGNYYIVIHSGSRHLGIVVAGYWEKKAVEYHKGTSKAKSELIARLKREGREKEIQKELEKIPEVIVSKELSYLEGVDLDGYLHDMEIAQEFARLNREAMMDVIITEMGIKRDQILDKWCTIHNYIDIKNGILRKGAISLQNGELAIIPINMRDGSLLVKGKGNENWNCSGPHGAGRLMSRSKAKETLSMEDYKSSMKGIFTTCVNSSTIDEAPMAYKPMDEIVENIKENAEIINIIKPIYNFKASE